MKFGVCCSPNIQKIAVLERAGFDYYETNLSNISAMTDKEFEAFLVDASSLSIPCEASNCFIPGEHKITIPGADTAQLKEYTKKALERAARLGVRSAVFGSGGARRIPKDMRKEEGQDKIVAFLRDIVSPEAEKYGIRMAVEPLNSKEDNAINSVAEGVAVARRTQRQNIRTLADIYHMLLDNDPIDALKKYPGDIIHAHISSPSRKFPRPDDGYSYALFLNALTAAGCERCSVEAGTDDFEGDVIKSLAVLRAWETSCG